MNMDSIFNEFKPAHFFKAYELNKPGVYLIHHVKSNKIYIGSTVDFTERTAKHLTRLKNDSHHCKAFKKDYDEDNWITFYFKPCKDQETAFDEEQKLLDKYIGKPFIYNKAPNARSQTGFKHSEETKQKMSAVRSTPEMKAFVSNLNKGRIASLETRQKISLGGMGRKPSERNKAITSKLFKGVPRTKEAIENMRIANLARSKPVMIEGVRYDSARVYHELTGMGRSTIEYRLNSTKPHFNNWSYVNE